MALSFGALRDRLLAGLLGDAEQAEAGRPMLMLDMLSDWLPYRVYDPASRLYVNARSKGFVLGVGEIIDVRGSGGRGVKDAGARQEILQANTCNPLLRTLDLAARAFAARSVGHGVRLVKDDHTVEVIARPVENLLKPGRVASA